MKGRRARLASFTKPGSVGLTSDCKSSAVDGDKALEAHDVYPFLERTLSLFRTGLTQTNVMDLRVVLLFPPGDLNIAP